MLQKPPRSVKSPLLPSSIFLAIAFIFLYLLLCLICPRKLEENSNQVYDPAKTSKHLLFTELLDCGHARLPRSTNEQSNTFKPSLGILHLLMILLLAGDVERNPGP